MQLCTFTEKSLISGKVISKVLLQYAFTIDTNYQNASKFDWPLGEWENTVMYKLYCTT